MQPQQVARRVRLLQPAPCRRDSAMASFTGRTSTPLLAPLDLSGGSAAAAAADAAACSPPPVEKRKRQRAPRIDIDASIAAAQAEMKKAAKIMADARRDTKNERRKKQRLMKKAAGLNSEDLERIAVLKRCGMWDPITGTKFVFGRCDGHGQPEEPTPPSASSSTEAASNAGTGASSPPAPGEDEASEAARDQDEV